MTQTQLSDEDEVEIVVRYQAGLTTRKLAERFGVSEAAIRRALDRHEVERRPVGFQRTVPVDDDEIVRLRDAEHHTWEEIAALLGIGPTTARSRYTRFLRRVG